MKQHIVFDINKNDILNSNVVKFHFVKAKMVSHLRNMSAEEGVKRHHSIELAEKRLIEIKEIAEKTLKKSRARKLMNKKNKPEEEITERLEEIEEEFGNIETTAVPYMFNKFKVTLTVCPPTKRKMDPPNLYPTLKALIDGLTDASWWQDDEFSQLLEVSFKYGGLSGEKDYFKLILDIEEIENTEDYIYEAEYIEREELNN